MLKIGQLSKLLGVSVETIRYYEKQGLICPAKVDEFTKYRFYDDSSVNRINEIKLYKSLGFSLMQIRNLSDKSLENKINQIKDDITNLTSNKTALTLHLREQTLKNIEFVNDEDLIGKWVFKQAFYRGKPFTKMKPFEDVIYFIENGETNCHTMWTKGKFIDYEYSTNSVKSTTYQIVKQKGRLVLKHQLSEDEFRLYEKVDDKKRSYDDMFTPYLKVDFNNFIEDPNLVGIWHSIGHVQNIDDFPSKTTKKLYIRYIIAIPENNHVTIRYNDERQDNLIYTKGYLQSHKIHRYFIKTINNKSYLYYEWNKNPSVDSKYVDYFVLEKLN